MLPFLHDLDVEKAIHVKAPTEVVFLCGGPYSDASEPVPLSLRDAFLKINDNPPLRKRILIQAEDISKESLFFNTYDNLLDFETHLAQLVELIILFCESEGSLAELGAFSMIEEISERLFVVVREKHWSADSFVKHGPLRLIERRHSRDYIFVIDDSIIGIIGDNPAQVDKNALKEVLKDPLNVRLSRTREPSTFNRGRAGHIIKLIVGFTQEYGALTFEEIVEVLNKIGVDFSSAHVHCYLLCAIALDWIAKVSRGTKDYYVAKLSNVDAVSFQMKADAKVKDRARRRLLIREHWKSTDQPRDRAINHVVGGGICV